MDEGAAGLFGEVKCVTLRHDVRFYLWRRQLCLKFSFDQVSSMLTPESFYRANAHRPLGFVSVNFFNKLSLELNAAIL